MRILVVDDEQANVSLLTYILQVAGYTQVRTTMDSRQAFPLFQEFHPDLVLLDLMMPHVSGLEVIQQLMTQIPAGDCLPILVLTADVSAATKYAALEAGASDFLTKPFDQIEVLLRIHHLLQIRVQHLQLTGLNDSLEDAVRERTQELTRTLGQLETTVKQLSDTRQQVIQHERLSAVGCMAAGLAHDFDNSLSLILGYGEMLTHELKTASAAPRTTQYLATMMTAAQDAALLFDRLQGFYRPADGQNQFQPVEVNVLVDQAVTLTRPRWHGQALGLGVTIDVDTNLAEGLPPLLADAAELREMLTNLIFNAVDAMPQGGTITLRTRRERAAGTSAGEGCVVLEVSDTGTGMDEETRRRCLEPFFTTKGKQGTGLGLAMVYGTMQRHGGSIDLQSSLGEGTTFAFSFPPRLLEDGETSSTPTVADPQPRKILVADDQTIFVTVLKQYLQSEFAQVETASDGRDALAKFEASVAGGDPFDLVITDRAMPHLNGVLLVAAIKAMAPGTPAILLTGMTIPGDGDISDVSAADLTLLKPITQAQLRAGIRRVMGGRQPVPVQEITIGSSRSSKNELAETGVPGIVVAKRIHGTGRVSAKTRPSKRSPR